MVEITAQSGKEAINLGLGINAGNRRFKEKWGGTAFLPFTSTFIGRKEERLEDLWQKL